MLFFAYRKKCWLVILRLPEFGAVSYMHVQCIIHWYQRCWSISHMISYILITFPWNLLWWFNVTATIFVGIEGGVMSVNCHPDSSTCWKKYLQSDCQCPSWMYEAFQNKYKKNPRNHHLHIISLPHLFDQLFFLPPTFCTSYCCFWPSAQDRLCPAEETTTGKGSDRVIVELWILRKQKNPTV